MSTAKTQIFTLPDGAKLGYEIQGAQHLGKKLPLAFICGMGSTKVDWDRIVPSLVKKRPGWSKF